MVVMESSLGDDGCGERRTIDETAWDAGGGQHSCSRFQAIREHGIALVPPAASAPFALQQSARKSAWQAAFRINLIIPVGNAVRASLTHSRYSVTILLLPAKHGEFTNL
jgi:hypothetical protein